MVHNHYPVNSPVEVGSLSHDLHGFVLACQVVGTVSSVISWQPHGGPPTTVPSAPGGWILGFFWSVLLGKGDTFVNQEVQILFYSIHAVYTCIYMTIDVRF